MGVLTDRSCGVVVLAGEEPCCETDHYRCDRDGEQEDRDEIKNPGGVAAKNKTATTSAGGEFAETVTSGSDREGRGLWFYSQRHGSRG